MAEPPQIVSVVNRPAFQWRIKDEARVGMPTSTRPPAHPVVLLQVGSRRAQREEARVTGAEVMAEAQGYYPSVVSASRVLPQGMAGDDHVAVEVEDQISLSHECADVAGQRLIRAAAAGSAPWVAAGG